MIAKKGKLWIVGAGPGDIDLLTVKAVRVISTADVLVYDKLVSKDILALAPAPCSKIFVGKTRGKHTLPQDRISQLLVDQTLAGLQVVRLKGGDPFVFGRGGEELDAARSAGIAVEVIPGITAALGCAAEAGIPLTHRDHASALTFVTGQCRDLSDQDWRGLAGPGRTLVIYMGLNGAYTIAGKLIADGLSASTPVAVVENGTRADMRVFLATLSTVAAVVARECVQSPALMIVGEVAALSKQNTHSEIFQQIIQAA